VLEDGARLEGQISREWRGFFIEELHDLYYSPNVIRAIK
jgi:hypothetical protein